MNKKGLAILMRTRMKPTSPPERSLPPAANEANNLASSSEIDQSDGSTARLAAEEKDKINSQKLNSTGNTYREFEFVRETMHSAISMNKTEVLDNVLNNFSEGYSSLSHENRRKLLLILAKEYDLNRTQIHEMMKQYLGLELPGGEKPQSSGTDDEGSLSAFYRTERNLRHALKPTYEVLFERLNTHPGGLKFLSLIRADILSILAEDNIASLRALDSYLKEKLITWLSPAALELHHITWDDSASLLEKIVAYEAVHPISSLTDLKRRLGVGRRCFGYLHPAIPGEPLIFIEVALLKNVAQTIQEFLWDDPPIPECESTCALFYSISSTQPGLAGINLGKFLIKRVIKLVKRDMPHISTFATLSPIPGFMQWLLSKLASQSKLAETETGGMSHSSEESFGSTFRENILEPEEERALLDSSVEFAAGASGMDVMWNLLTDANFGWINSARLLSVLKPPLMRLCARYLLQEKKRGKALDSVANFHLQNGAVRMKGKYLFHPFPEATPCSFNIKGSNWRLELGASYNPTPIIYHLSQMVERLNWMADRSEKGLLQSGGIMVNYVYRVDNIEEYAHSYFSSGHIHSSDDLCFCVEPLKENETTKD